MFQQLRDRPQFNAECWLARRIFSHYGLKSTAVRNRIRHELMKERPENERDEWNAALLVLFVARRQAGLELHEYCVLQESERTDEILAEKWFVEVILPSGGVAPHMMVRARGDRAKVVWSCYSDKNLGSINAPYKVKPVPVPGVVMIVQDLGDYLGPLEPFATERLLTYLFSGSNEGVPTVKDTANE